MVCHDLDTLDRSSNYTNGIPGQLDTAMVDMVSTKSPKLSGFDPVEQHLITDGIIKIKDTTDLLFHLYTSSYRCALVCDSATIVNADFLACCMPPSIRCPRDTVYPPTIM
jgi:hypothetical protein